LTLVVCNALITLGTNIGSQFNLFIQDMVEIFPTTMVMKKMDEMKH